MHCFVSCKWHQEANIFAIEAHSPRTKTEIVSNVDYSNDVKSGNNEKCRTSARRIVSQSGRVEPVLVEL